jgi:hypothetical protein
LVIAEIARSIFFSRGLLEEAMVLGVEFLAIMCFSIDKSKEFQKRKVALSLFLASKI